MFQRGILRQYTQARSRTIELARQRDNSFSGTYLSIGITLVPLHLSTPWIAGYFISYIPFGFEGGWVFLWIWTEVLSGFINRSVIVGNLITNTVHLFVTRDDNYVTTSNGLTSISFPVALQSSPRGKREPSRLSRSAQLAMMTTRDRRNVFNASNCTSWVQEKSVYTSRERVCGAFACFCRHACLNFTHRLFRISWGVPEYTHFFVGFGV